MKYEKCEIYELRSVFKRFALGLPKTENTVNEKDILEYHHFDNSEYYKLQIQWFPLRETSKEITSGFFWVS